MDRPAPPATYDQFAEAYTADNETNAYNALYERPAMLALLGEVRGKRVLDAGCGAGALAAALLDRGALVTGLEVSECMAELDRARLGDGPASTSPTSPGRSRPSPAVGQPATVAACRSAGSGPPDRPPCGRGPTGGRGASRRGGRTLETTAIVSEIRPSASAGRS